MIAPESKVCTRCGAAFKRPARRGSAQWERQEFCSISCGKRRRLDELVDRSAPNGCWRWLGTIHPTGYGHMMIGGKTLQAHRYVYETLAGPIPPGLHLDHLCRNRACVNPEHLEPVTCRVNVLRGEGPPARNAVATHCVQGHPFDDENTHRQASGRRVCLACRRESGRRYQERQRDQAT